jgi:hypothetical protein
MPVASLGGWPRAHARAQLLGAVQHTLQCGETPGFCTPATEALLAATPVQLSIAAAESAAKIRTTLDFMQSPLYEPTAMYPDQDRGPHCGLTVI